MGVEGLEPSRPKDQQILSLLCLPFHHTPIICFCLDLGGTQIWTGGKGFAIPGLTTWLYRLGSSNKNSIIQFFILVHNSRKFFLFIEICTSLFYLRINRFIYFGPWKRRLFKKSMASRVTKSAFVRVRLPAPNIRLAWRILALSIAFRTLRALAKCGSFFLKTI